MIKVIEVIFIKKIKKYYRKVLYIEDEDTLIWFNKLIAEYRSANKAIKAIVECYKQEPKFFNIENFKKREKIEFIG